MARRTTASPKPAPRGPSATSVKGTETAAAALPGLGLGEVLAIVSTLMLLAAILTTDYFMAHKLGQSVFFGP